jgi:hypothetical protein
MRYRRRMTHTPPSEVARADSDGKHSPVVSRWTSPRTIAFAALAIAVVAAVAAIAAWIHPGGSHSYSDQQSAQAKTNVCAAARPVHQAVWVGTPNPHPGDPVAQLAVAANVRLAMLGGGAYLRETLAAEPATPADLAKAVTSMATTLQQMGINYLARTGDKNVMASLKHDLDTEGAQVAGLCKK